MPHQVLSDRDGLEPRWRSPDAQSSLRTPPRYGRKASTATCAGPANARQRDLPAAPVDNGDDALAELGVLIASTTTWPPRPQLSNRIHGLLTGIHPALERVLGPRVTHTAVLEILSRRGGPASIRKAGRRGRHPHAPRMGDNLVDQILTALDGQTVTAPGTTAADTVRPRLTDSPKTRLQQRKAVADEIEGMLDAPSGSGPDLHPPTSGASTPAPAAA